MSYVRRGGCRWDVGAKMTPLIGLAVNLQILRSVSTAKTAQLRAHAAEVSGEQGADLGVVNRHAGGCIG